MPDPMTDAEREAREAVDRALTAYGDAREDGAGFRLVARSRHGEAIDAYATAVRAAERARCWFTREDLRDVEAAALLSAYPLAIRLNAIAARIAALLPPEDQ